MFSKLPLRMAVLALLAVFGLAGCGGGSGGNTTPNPTYTVTYDGNGSDSGTVPTDSTKHEAEQIVTVLGNTGALVKAGYSFVGWNTASNGTGTTYAQAQTFTIGAANVTLYAKWTANPTYSITYDGNGSAIGSVPTDSTNYEQGQTVTVLGNAGNLTKTGYSFVGWNTLANGTGTTYTQTQTFAMGSANVILYAKWTANPTYTVTYNGNGNTLGTVPIDTVSYEQGRTVTVLGNTGNLAKSKYTFGGWNTLADGTGTTYGATFVMGTINATLYAKWNAAVPGTGIYDSPANPIIVTAQTDTTHAVTATIPITGGTMTATGADGSVFTLTIPADALQFPTEITMTPVSSIPDLPFASGLGAAVKLEPEGLRFYNFVTLTIEPATAIPPAQQTFFGFQKGGDDFHLEPPALDNTVIQLKLMHFSGAGVSSGTAADRAAILLHNAADAENRLQQSMSEQIRQARENGTPVDASFFAANWQEYMDQVVTPRVQAASTSCANGKLALQTLILFMREKELLGIGADTSLQALVNSLIPQVANQCLSEAYDVCVTQHDLTEITSAVLGYERQRQLLGYTDTTMPWDASQMLIKQCLQFELTFSSTEAAGTTAAVTGKIPLVADLSAFPQAIKIKSLSSPSPLDLTSVSSVGACSQPGIDNSNNMNFIVSNLNFVFGGTGTQQITNIEMEYLPLSPASGLAETSCGATPVPLATVLGWNTNYLFTHQLEDNGTGTLVSRNWTYLGGDPFAQRIYSFTPPGYGQTTMTLRHTPGAIDVTDVTAPTVPSGLVVTATSASEIDLSWGAATDGVGVKGYKVYRDGTYIKPTTATSMLNTGLTASTQYCYQVSAYDAAGNESAMSAAVCATTLASGTTNMLFDVIWSGTQFVAVGYNGTILTSPTGSIWTVRTSGTTDPLFGVTWSGTQYVAVGSNGSTHDTILTSPTGSVWTAQTLTTGGALLDVTWSGTQFVAVGLGYVLTSPDGVTWTAFDNVVGNLYSVTWNGTQFLATSDINGCSTTTVLRNAVWTSSNGTSWTCYDVTGLSSDMQMSGVAWSGIQYVGVAVSSTPGSTYGATLTSPNGAVWTVRASSSRLLGVTWSGTQYVAVGDHGAILTSPDGITWSAQTSGTTNLLRGVTWSGTQFVAVGWAGTILTSPDGVTWTKR